jgi:hypothetical protein
MLVLARLLTVLAVLLVTAQPVMACCLAGQTAPIIKMSPDTEQPCHGDGMRMQTASDGVTHSMPGDADCPGCTDCDSPVMQAQALDNAAVLSPSASEIPVALHAVHFPGFAHTPVILKTGPPEAPPFVHVTPLELKQRLLI